MFIHTLLVVYIIFSLNLLIFWHCAGDYVCYDWWAWDIICRNLDDRWLWVCDPAHNDSWYCTHSWASSPHQLRRNGWVCSQSPSTLDSPSDAGRTGSIYSGSAEQWRSASSTQGLSSTFRYCILPHTTLHVTLLLYTLLVDTQPFFDLDEVI